jgi:hypothetical protein
MWVSGRDEAPIVIFVRQRLFIIVTQPVPVLLGVALSHADRFIHQTFLSFVGVCALLPTLTRFPLNTTPNQPQPARFALAILKYRSNRYEMDTGESVEE